MTSNRERVLGAMRSGEWLRTQWIARTAFDAPPPQPHGLATQRAIHHLLALEAEGLVERRDAEEIREGEVADVQVRFAIPRSEWRLVK